MHRLLLSCVAEGDKFFIYMPTGTLSRKKVGTKQCRVYPNLASITLFFAPFYWCVALMICIHLALIIALRRLCAVTAQRLNAVFLTMIVSTLQLLMQRRYNDIM